MQASCSGPSAGDTESVTDRLLQTRILKLKLFGAFRVTLGTYPILTRATAFRPCNGHAGQTHNPITLRKEGETKTRTTPPRRRLCGRWRLAAPPRDFKSRSQVRMIARNRILDQDIPARKEISSASSWSSSQPCPPAAGTRTRGEARRKGSLPIWVYAEWRLLTVSSQGCAGFRGPGAGAGNGRSLRRSHYDGLVSSCQTPPATSSGLKA